MSFRGHVAPLLVTGDANLMLGDVSGDLCCDDDSLCAAAVMSSSEVTLGPRVGDVVRLPSGDPGPPGRIPSGDPGPYPDRPIGGGDLLFPRSRSLRISNRSSSSADSRDIVIVVFECDAVCVHL